MYDPRLGRFLQVDPIGYDAGDLNLYRYCRNNGVISSDPYGLFTITVGAAASFTVTNLNATKGIGVEAEAGFAAHSEDKSYSSYESVGKSGGFNISSGLAIGVYKSNSIAGHATNIHVVIGPVTITAIYDMSGQNLEGLKVTIGPGIPLGFSASETITLEQLILRLLKMEEELCL